MLVDVPKIQVRTSLDDPYATEDPTVHRVPL